MCITGMAITGIGPTRVICKSSPVRANVQFHGIVVLRKVGKRKSAGRETTKGQNQDYQDYRITGIIAV
jgi:hypothetical protein